MKRPYEAVIVFDGTLSDEVLQKEQAQIEEFLKQNSAFEKTDVWGKRALAYAINKKKSGYYCLFLFEAEGGVPAALEHHMKLNEKVLRHLIVVRDLKNEAARAAYVVRRDAALEMPVPPRAAAAVAEEE